MISAIEFILFITGLIALLFGFTFDSVGLGFGIFFLGTVALIVLDIVVNIKFYQKLGLDGWEWLVPLFSQYRVCEVIYGKDEGWKGLFQFIPVVGLIFKFLYFIRIAEVFDKSKVYGAFMFVFNMPLFYILSFGKSVLNEDLINENIERIEEPTSDIIEDNSVISEI